MFDLMIYLIFSLVFSLVSISVLEQEEKVTSMQRYTSTINQYFIVEVIFFIIAGAFKPGKFPKFLPMFFHVTLYYTVLSLLLPKIRQYISSRSVVVMWVIPYLMYLLVDGRFSWISNTLIIPVSSSILKGFYYINIIGAICIFGWAIIQHFLYKKWLLEKAYPMIDSHVLEIYEGELKKANFKKKKYRLMISENAQTPLSIGIFEKSMIIVLPNRQYTDQELSLIFRHELVHIGKRDVYSKLCLLFWCAVCWYNPFVWIAKRKCLEDIELSCDETVLLDEDMQTKKLYANLILTTTAKQTGFTTCLSTDAKGLKYRLESILNMKKKSKGYLLVAMSIFVMMISYGHVSVAYDFVHLNEFIEDKEVLDYNYFGDEEILLVDEKGLMEYLKNLQLCKLSMTKHYDTFPEYSFSFEGVYVALSDHWVMINSEEEKMALYYVKSSIDFDRIRQFFDSRF